MGSKVYSINVLKKKWNTNYSNVQEKFITNDHNYI